MFIQRERPVCGFSVEFCTHWARKSLFDFDIILYTSLGSAVNEISIPKEFPL